jgi:hypothetical protein
MRMNAHQLVDMRPVTEGRGYLYSFTPDGLQRMGFIATKQGD